MKEKDFDFVHFPETPKLSITDYDMVQLLKNETFDISHCGCQLFIYVVENKLIESLKVLLTLFPPNMTWKNSHILCIGNSLDRFESTEPEEDEEDDDYDYHEEHDFEEKGDVEEEEEEEEVDDDDDEEEMFSEEFSYDFFFSVRDNETETHQIYESYYDKETITHKTFLLVLNHNEFEIIEKISSVFSDISFSKSSFFRISLSQNNDEFTVKMLQKFGNDMTLFFFKYLEILDYAIHSTCEKSLEYLTKKENFEEMMKNSPRHDGNSYFGYSYFNAFFIAPNKQRGGERLLSRLIEKEEEEEDEDENDISSLMGDLHYDKYISGISSNFDSLSQNFYFPIDRKEYDEHYYIDPDDEDEIRINSEYKEEEFFQKEEDEYYKSKEGIKNEKERIGRPLHRRGIGSRRLRFAYRQSIKNGVNKKDMMKLMRKAGIFSTSYLPIEEGITNLRNTLTDLIKDSWRFQQCRLSQNLSEDDKETKVDQDKYYQEIDMREKKEEEDDDEEEEHENNIVTEEDVKNSIESYMRHNLQPHVASRMKKQMEVKTNNLKYLEQIM